MPRPSTGPWTGTQIAIKDGDFYVAPSGTEDFRLVSVPDPSDHDVGDVQTIAQPDIDLVVSNMTTYNNGAYTLGIITGKTVSGWSDAPNTPSPYPLPTTAIWAPIESPGPFNVGITIGAPTLPSGFKVTSVEVDCTDADANTTTTVLLTRGNQSAYPGNGIGSHATGIHTSGTTGDYTITVTPDPVIVIGDNDGADDDIQVMIGFENDSSDPDSVTVRAVRIIGTIQGPKIAQWDTTPGLDAQRDSIGDALLGSNLQHFGLNGSTSTVIATRSDLDNAGLPTWPDSPGWGFFQHDSQLYMLSAGIGDNEFAICIVTDPLHPFTDPSIVTIDGMPEGVLGFGCTVFDLGDGSLALFVHTEDSTGGAESNLLYGTIGIARLTKTDGTWAATWVGDIHTPGIAKVDIPRPTAAGFGTHAVLNMDDIDYIVMWGTDFDSDNVEHILIVERCQVSDFIAAVTANTAPAFNKWNGTDWSQPAIGGESYDLSIGYSAPLYAPYSMDVLTTPSGRLAFLATTRENPADLSSNSVQGVLLSEEGGFAPVGEFVTLNITPGTVQTYVSAYSGDPANPKHWADTLHLYRLSSETEFGTDGVGRWSDAVVEHRRIWWSTDVDAPDTIGLPTIAGSGSGSPTPIDAFFEGAGLSGGPVAFGGDSDFDLAGGVTFVQPDSYAGAFGVHQYPLPASLPGAPCTGVRLDGVNLVGPGTGGGVWALCLAKVSDSSIPSGTLNGPGAFFPGLGPSTFGQFLTGVTDATVELMLTTPVDMNDGDYVVVVIGAGEGGSPALPNLTVEHITPLANPQLVPIIEALRQIFAPQVIIGDGATAHVLPNGPGRYDVQTDAAGDPLISLPDATTQSAVDDIEIRGFGATGLWLITVEGTAYDITPNSILRIWATNGTWYIAGSTRSSILD